MRPIRCERQRWLIRKSNIEKLVALWRARLSIMAALRSSNPVYARREIVVRNERRRMHTPLLYGAGGRPASAAKASSISLARSSSNLLSGINGMRALPALCEARSEKLLMGTGGAIERIKWRLLIS